MLAVATGKVYLVGAGPGDPGLVTVKGLDRIRSADCVLYDSLISMRLLNETRSDCERIYVGHRSGSRTLNQDEINGLLIANAKAGKIVVRLKGGDPFVFGRGGEECEALARAGVPFEVVPGITSAIAAPAYAGIPITHRDVARSVAFITGHQEGDDDLQLNLPGAISGADTLVFLMGVRNLPQIVDRLIESGHAPTTAVALIRWGTKPEQRTLIGDLSGIVELAENEDFQGPALIVVGEVVHMRKRLSWFEKKPLFGRRILVTRTRQQAPELIGLLEDLGGEAVAFPTIQIEDPDDWGPVDDAIRQLKEFHWIVFTSANGVDRFFARLFQAGFDARAVAGSRLCTIGPGTASRLKDYGLHPDLLPEQNVAESLVEAFGKQDLCGKKILLPRAAVARDVLPGALSKMGAEVCVVAVYRTVRPGVAPDSMKDKFKRGEVDLVTFTSSSTVSNFVDLLSQGGGNSESLTGSIKGASIGPITTQAARDYGIEIVAEADPYDMTVSGLVKAIERYYQHAEQPQKRNRRYANTGGSNEYEGRDER